MTNLPPQMLARPCSLQPRLSGSNLGFDSRTRGPRPDAPERNGVEDLFLVALMAKQRPDMQCIIYPRGWSIKPLLEGRLLACEVDTPSGGIPCLLTTTHLCMATTTATACDKDVGNHAVMPIAVAQVPPIWWAECPPRKSGGFNKEHFGMIGDASISSINPIYVYLYVH